MSTILNLPHAISLISSDKVKDRQEGLLFIKEIFSRKGSVEQISQTGNGNSRDGENNGFTWLRIFQALFGYVGVERGASLKVVKSTSGASTASAAVTRFRHVTHEVRLLIELTMHSLNKRTISCIFSHLIQTLIYKGDLLPTIGIDYAKALLAILSYRPHLEWLDDRNWRVVLSLCFDVAEGRKDLSFDRDEWDVDVDEEDREEEERLGGTGREGSKRKAKGKGNEREVLHSDEEEDELEDTTNLNGKRTLVSSSKPHATTLNRSRASTIDSNSTNTNNANSSIAKGDYQSTVDLLIECIPILLASPHAPLLPVPRFQLTPECRIPTRAGVTVLQRISKYLTSHPVHQKAHNSMLTGLMIVLQELELNFMDQVSIIGTEIFPYLVDLWPPKDGIQDQLLVCLRILLPFLCRTSSFCQSSLHTRAILTLPDIILSPLIADSLSKLINSLPHARSAGKPWEPLDLDELWLTFKQDQGGKGTAMPDHPFVLKGMRAGTRFEVGSGVTWAGLELQADSIAKLHQHVNSATRNPERQTQKRQRFEDPVQTLLQQINGPNKSRSQPLRLFHLQTVLFLVERHWSILHDQLQEDICSAMTNLLTDPTAVIQQWALLVLNSVLLVELENAPKVSSTTAPSSKVSGTDYLGGTQGPSQAPTSPFVKTSFQHKSPKDRTEFWESIWSICLRKVNLSAGSVNRSACHLANGLWRSGAIDKSKATKGIEAFLRDITVQGPIEASDAVCSFLTTALDVVAQDVVLLRSGLEDNVCNWLIATGLDFGFKRSGSSPKSKSYSVFDTLRLISRLLGFQMPDLTLGGQIVLADNPVVNYMIQERRHRELRDFMLYTKLPAGANQKGQRLEVYQLKSANSGHGESSNQQRIVRIASALKQRAHGIAEEWDEAGPLVPTPSARATIRMTQAEQSSTTANSGSHEGLLRALDFACLASLTEISIVWQDEDQSIDVLAPSSKLFGIALTKTLHRTWKPLERCHLLSALEPLLGVYDQLPGPENLSPILIKPAKVDGIVRLSKELDQPLPAVFDWKTLLVRLWQTPEMTEMYHPLVESLRGLLRQDDENVGVSLAPKTDEDDDAEFAIKTEEDAQSKPSDALKTSVDSLAANATRIIVRALLRPRFYHNGAIRPVKDKVLLNQLIESDAPFFLILGPPIMTAVQEGVIDFKPEAMEGVFDAIQDFLRTYPYAASSDMRIAAIDFVSVTRHLWTSIGIADNGGVEVMIGMMQRFAELLDCGRLENWKVRDAMIRAFCSYVVSEPDCGTWNEYLASSQPELIPLNLIRDALEDPDTRIRTQASIAVTILFGDPLVMQHLAEPWKIYTDISEHFLISPKLPLEQLCTRLLLFANISVVNAVCRRASLFHMYDMLHERPAMCPAVFTSLSGLSASLQLPSIKPLYLEYAPRITASQLENGQERLKVPVQLSGCENKADWTKTILPAIGWVVVQVSGASPEKWAEFHHNDGAHHLRAAMPPVIALNLSFVLKRYDPADGMASMDDLMQGVLSNWKAKYRTLVATFKPKSSVSFEEICDPYLVIGHVFRLIDHIENLDAIYDVLLSQSGGEHMAKTFSSLTGRGSNCPLETLHEINMPRASFSQVLEAFKWATRHFASQLDLEKLAYHILTTLVCQIDSTILINERRRFLRNLAIAIVLVEKQLESKALLSTLLRHVALLFASEDLAPYMILFVTWMLTSTRVLELADDASARSIVDIAGFANRHRLANVDNGATCFERFLATMETSLSAAYSAKKCGPLVLKILLLWPQTLPMDLNDLLQESPFDSTASLLQNVSVGPSRFSLAKELDRRFRSGQFEGDCENLRVSIFWHMRTTLPSRDANWNDVLAFLRLLLEGWASIEIPNDRTLDLLRLDPRIPMASFGKLTVDQSVSRSLLKIVYRVYDSHIAGEFANMKAALKVLGQLLHLPPIDNQMTRTTEVVRRELALMHRICPDPAKRSRNSIESLVEDSSWLNKATIFSIWISDLTNLLATAASASYPLTGSLEDLLSADTDAAARILPALVHLQVAAELFAAKEPTQMEHSRDAISTHFSFVLGDENSAPESLQAIIETVLYLRTMPYPGAASRMHLASDAWLKLDYGSLCRAAVRCKAFPSAIMFWEIAHDLDSPARKFSPALSPEEEDELMYQMYSNTEDPDGFYGMPPSPDTHTSLLRRLKHESDWRLAFAHRGADFEANPLQNTSALGEALCAFGFNQLAVLAMQPNAKIQTPGVISYGLAWRIGHWDLPETSEDGQDSDRPLYHVLKALHRAHENSALNGLLQDSIYSELTRLRERKEEDILGLRNTSLRLLQLREVQSWLDTFLRFVHKDDFANKAWEDFTAVPQGISLAHGRELMAVRISLLQSASATEGPSMGVIRTDKAKELQELEVRCRLALSSLARGSSDLHGAITSMAQIRKLTGTVTRHQPMEVVHEGARVLWMQGEHASAINQLRQALRMTGSFSGRSEANTDGWKALTLSLLGEWIAEAKQADPETLERDYFEVAVSHAKKASLSASISVKDHAKVLHRYAQFADSQQAYAAEGSSEVQRLNQEQERMTREISALKTGKANMDESTRQKRQTILINDRQRDQEMIAKYQKRRTTTLTSALINYGKALALSDDHGESMMRLVALWLENSSNELVNKNFKTALEGIPTHKFAFLAHQLTSRLTMETLPGQALFQKALDRLILTMAMEHPFHVFYQILTMAYPVHSYPVDRRSSTNPISPREKAAMKIHEKLRVDKERGPAIREMECFVKAAVQWSWYPVSEENAKIASHDVPKEVGLARISRFKIPVVTAPLELDLSKKYNKMVTIEGYERKYGIAGGVHHPKIMICRGSNGERYKELFKSDDDLRQDTVMEQFFELVNRLLQRDEGTFKRHLRFRTYKVLPLANKSGIIEFVGDTQAIGEWLNPAHRSYHPNDLPAREFKEQMRKLQDQETHGWTITPETSDLPALFVKLRENFHPVMRHFFTENRKDPIAWYAMRLRYARSLAVGSMVGHAVGLGDRHCSNILIDKISGELVHIDLGIAFDQGRNLQVPERVPFRLTNDLVDALGTSGVEGVYKRCCEQTLRVLRDNSQIVLTVLEVFKYDPLHIWAKVKLDNVQDGVRKGEVEATVNTNAPESGQADRVLGEISKKLNKHMSIEYTVNELIRTARDPKNLAVIYSGWQPWL